MNKKIVEIMNFYKGKRVLITGHTGFKGTWLCMILKEMGAEIIGISLALDNKSKFFNLASLKNEIIHIEGDVREYDMLLHIVKEYRPEILFHLAAQSLVLEGYEYPWLTFNTNVLGTINVLEVIRNTDSITTGVIITTDKVYSNQEKKLAFTETDLLGGNDPYSASKACDELIVKCYYESFFKNRNVRISTVRSGNVIGGGDFSIYRILPDCVRSIINNNSIVLRNPQAVRSYQHVLEALFAYLLIECNQSIDFNIVGSYNIGPDENDSKTTLEIVNMFFSEWGNFPNIEIMGNELHEDQFLLLDCSKIKSLLKWTQVWDIHKAIVKTVEWFKSYYENENCIECMKKQISEFIIDCDW